MVRVEADHFGINQDYLFDESFLQIFRDFGLRFIIGMRMTTKDMGRGLMRMEMISKFKE